MPQACPTPGTSPQSLNPSLNLPRGLLLSGTPVDASAVVLGGDGKDNVTKSQSPGQAQWHHPPGCPALALPHVWAASVHPANTHRQLAKLAKFLALSHFALHNCNLACLSLTLNSIFLPDIPGPAGHGPGCGPCSRGHSQRGLAASTRNGSQGRAAGPSQAVFRKLQAGETLLPQHICGHHSG